MNKKAQLGQTMTWMVAFVVIFFAVTIFLVAVLIMSGSKALFEKDEILIEDYEANINSQKVLIDILNSNMEDGKSVKKFIIEGIEDPTLVKGPLKISIDERLQNLGTCDYLLSIGYNPENLAEYNEGRADLLYRKVSFGSITSTKLLDKGSSLSLFAGEVRIRVKFYIGGCKNA